LWLKKLTSLTTFFFVSRVRTNSLDLLIPGMGVRLLYQTNFDMKKNIKLSPAPPPFSAAFLMLQG